MSERLIDNDVVDLAIFLVFVSVLFLVPAWLGWHRERRAARLARRIRAQEALKAYDDHFFEQCAVDVDEPRA
jgi:hypothetical protein